MAQNNGFNRFILNHLLNETQYYFEIKNYL